MFNRNQIYGLLLATALLPLGACSQSAGEPNANEPETKPAQADSHGSDTAKATTPGHAEHESQSASGHETNEADDAHEEHNNERAVHLSETQRQRLQLTVNPAESGSATSMVQAPATVAFDADRVARVGPRLQAKVLAVTADLGDAVAAGDTVAILDSAALGRAKAAYLTASAMYQSARAEYRRDRTLAKQKITSQSALLTSKATYLQARAERSAARAELRLYGLDSSDISSISVGGEQPLSRYVLTSPIAGTVQQRDLVQGQTVSADHTPIHIVDNQRMWVMIAAYEQAVPRLAPGQAVALRIRALPEQTFRGKTDFVSSELDAQNRTVRVRAVMPNDKGLLRAGMFGTAEINTDDSARFALVPVDAVQNVGEDDVVFVPGHEDGAFRAVTVRTGAESKGQVEIRSGLAPGDRLVTTGAFDLKSALTAAGRSASHSH